MRSIRRSLVAVLLAGLTAAPQLFAAQVQSVTGSVGSTVIQFHGIFPIQSDFSQISVPLTQANPPATATARLDRLLSDGSITAAGQVLSLFDNPNISGIGNPNDIGFDLGAFSNDDITTWFARSDASETRTVVLSTSDFSGNALNGTVAKAKSRVLISGVMLLTASNKGQDLTGATVKFSFTLTISQSGRSIATPLTGEVTLAGIPNGDAQVENATGAMSNLFLPIQDFTGQVPDLPVARAIAFTGTNFQYDMEVIVGQPFDIQLTTRSELRTIPGGVGAASVFGAPQLGLASVLSKVKGNDSGQQLADAVAKKVDTTGQAYANTPVDAPTQTLPIFSACGVTGFEAPLMLSVFGLIFFTRGSLRRRRLG